MLVVTMETFQCLCARGCSLHTWQMLFVAVPEQQNAAGILRKLSL